MAWTKSPPELVALWDEVVPEAPGIVKKPMFGYPAAFVNGRHIGGLFQDSVVVRLPEEDYVEFMRQPGARPFEPMAGRTMKGYALAPPELLQDKPALTHWLERAFAAAAKMPPKEAKPKKAKAKAQAPGSSSRG
jgi:TfoX/Sxy family transcriptional regulator of competence genes